MEDCCAVCAEPLEWVACGPCGHKEACSKCVTRLRFVLKDQRCVICQQASPAVFVTRFLGAYTKALPAAEFEQLQAGNVPRGVYHLRTADAFFDDRGHFDEIRKLCSYTHPALLEQAEGGEPAPAHFRSLGALKGALQGALQLHFCDLCLENRKVFIPEQILYSKADLARHQRSGDTEGLLAESGFKGHPLCRFCNRRFFGENELFFHMQQAHEQCHLCKRAHPDRFEYFPGYAELEEHFRNEHYLCGHPACLERHFVVFVSEQELRQHTAREHAGSMSRAERRQALTVPINVQFAPRPAPEQQQRQRGRGRGGRFAEPDPREMATALQASMDTAGDRQQGPSGRQQSTARQQQAEPSRPQGPNGQPLLNELEFPSMGGGAGPSLAGGGYGAAAAGAGGAPRAEEFPALPAATKAEKRRAREREAEARTLAERLARPGEVRVLNAGGPAAGARLRSEAFPALSHSSSAPQLSAAGAAQWRPAAAGAAAAAPAPPTAAAGPRPSDFPALPGAPAQQRLQARQQPQLASRRQVLREAEFPSLGPAATPAAAAAAAPSSSAAAAVANGAEAAPAQRGVSEGMKAANKALIEKVRRQLEPAQFAAFRAQAVRFASGECDAPAYHAHVSSLGLAPLVPEMAALLPDAQRRAQLLAAHEAAGPSPSGRWMPPEAAAAALKQAKTQPSWQCAACTLINEPRAAACEACGSKRPLNDLGALSRAAAEASGSGVGGSGAAAAAGGGKGKKVTKFERMRLTSGGTDPAFQAEVERRTKPNNAWTHQHSLAQSLAVPKPKSAWGGAGAGKLAGQLSAVQKAWTRDA